MCRLYWCYIRNRGNHKPSGLRLPPCIDNRTSSFPNVRMIPMPCLFVDRLTHRTQYLEMLQIVCFHEAEWRAFQGTDCRGGGIENVHAMLFSHMPEPAHIRPGGNALKHQGSCSSRQGAINNVGVSCNPTNIGRTPEHLPLLVLKCGKKGIGDKDHITSAGVDHSLGP